MQSICPLLLQKIYYSPFLQLTPNFCIVRKHMLRVAAKVQLYGTVFQITFKVLLCESKNREHFDLTLTFELCDDQSDERSKTASHKANNRYSLRFLSSCI